MYTTKRAQPLGLLISLGALLLAPAALAAPTLEQELSAIEWIPTKAALLRHGANVDARLRGIAAQGGKPLARHRALGALRLFPSADSAKFLRNVVERNRGVRGGVNALYLQQALSSYAAVVGPEALEYAAAFLPHQSIDMRCYAAEAVRLTRSPRARATLLARLEVETSPTVKAELLQQLRRLAIDELRAAGKAE